MKNPTTYVLVHGAWHGGWCWSRVAERLRAAGHRVHTPTLTGLGERSHLLSPAIGLETFMQDICNVLTWEDLRDVVLVGHSFGGLAISGAADRMPERIRRLVYLDAFLLPPGVSAFDTLPAAVVAKLEEKTTKAGGIAPPRPANLGLEAPDDIAFVQGRLTPHPVGTYREAMRLAHPLGNGLPASYWRCVRPIFPSVQDARDWAWTTFGTQWDWKDLDCGHDAMVAAPDLVAESLMALG
ncbi:alpha/beta fold hydrolase [Castellaniella sp. UC4442_H9]|jgi:pimeloyl-ACP methyl ester carboxylesterase|nr:alpha/beta hydrolase [Castellaniella sp.]